MLAGNAAAGKPKHRGPVDAARQPMHHAAAGLGRGGIQQVGADGGIGWMPNSRINNGVISEPPPTPVMPTKRPTPKPEAM